MVRGSCPKSVIEAEALDTVGCGTPRGMKLDTSNLLRACFLRPHERKRIEVLIETFLRKQLRLKAHTVTKVEETERCLLVHIDRLGHRLLRCGVCRQRCRKVHSVRKAREWRDLSMRKLPLKLRYRPRRVECPRCGVRVEDFPWAEPWARVTTALSNAVAMLARELSWQGTARQYGLNWKSVATIVKRAVQYGLRHRKRPPVHVIGIDEVSRRKGPGVSHGGLRSGAAGFAVGRRRPDRRGSEAVFHRGNGPPALSDAAGGVHGHVGGVRQTGSGTRAERADPV